MNEHDKIILIIGAMHEEVSALTARMTSSCEKKISDITYFQGKLAGKNVVVAQSGVGKVNAAYTTTILTHKFNPALIINIGSAGGMQENQTVGDIVIAQTLRYHDLDIGPDTQQDPRFIFEIDQGLVLKTEAILAELNLPYHKGLIVSGDQFVTKDSSSFKTIQTKFSEAIAVEMEACAVGAVAQKMATPIIVLRALSDVTHHENNSLDFESYLALASENSARICEAYVKEN